MAMNKKKLITSALAVMMAMTAVVPMAACKEDFNPETRPLVMSLGTPDGVFNPFFSTSAYDSTVVGMTQISMLAADANGKVVCGENEPVVVKDYKITTEGEGDNQTTTYEFILKNGIKFSDGTPLTMKDVLFNLYTYLDPAYTGSATIYSTKIKGLAEYRTQNPDATEGSMSAFEEGFYADANKHIDDLVDYVRLFNKTANDDKDANGKTQGDYSEEERAQLKADFDKTRVEFKKELETDWNTSASSKESYVDWGITETWQIFLLNDGGETPLLMKDPDDENKLYKDENGNYKLDPAASAERYDVYKEWLVEVGKTESEETVREWAIEQVYTNYFPTEADETANYLGAVSSSSFSQVIKGWATATTMMDYFAAQAKSEYFKGQGKLVPAIEGIDGSGKTTRGFDGSDLGAEHEVLKITIDGVDPKAIWNFAFTVSPMHYYSTTNYEGKNYIEAFDMAKGEFGLAFGDFNFMNTVINAPEKVGYPVGAGVYKASGAGSGDFFKNNIVYFERNDNFQTLGSGISNAKIKYLRYKVVESDQIINSLANGDIDFGDPSATQDNIAILDEKGIRHVEIDTNGYGYVGINARFIPDVTVRRAIMKAMDKSIIVNNYYKGGLASIIERPISKTSWAYPKGVPMYESQDGTSYEHDALGNEIKTMMEDAGYLLNEETGIFFKEVSGFGTVTCDYTFTIAGASKDHPAMAMFEKAANILNKIGFKIKVVNSQTALSDLATGKLTVWAAAWSSAIDPDMYQVYHVDSQATSTSNWGYKQIKAGSTTEAYSDEYALITELSEWIDKGRETTIQKEREEIYAYALDLIMELAVEMPTYQRKDMSAFNGKLLDESTMTPENERTPLNGLLSRLWELDYVD